MRLVCLLILAFQITGKVTVNLAEGIVITFGVDYPELGLADEPYTYVRVKQSHLNGVYRTVL